MASGDFPMSYGVGMMDEIARQYANTSAQGSHGQPETYMPGERLSQGATASEGLENVDYQDQLSSILETNSAMMRRSIMDFYQRLKAQMLAEQRAAVEAEREVANQKLAAKQEEIELLKDDLAVHKSALTSQQAVVSRACIRIAALNEQWRSRRYMREYFTTWAQYTKRSRRLEKLMVKAKAMYDVEFLQRKTMRAWAKRASTDMKKKVKERIQAAVEDTENRCRQEAAAEIASMRQQVAETQKALAAERQGKEMLAQDMKRSFMRGVCALNMEAMQVMKRGVEPGGMNPNPTFFKFAASDDGEPQPEEIPASIQNMMSSLNMTGPADMSSSRAGIRPQVLRHSPVSTTEPAIPRTMAASVRQ